MSDDPYHDKKPYHMAKLMKANGRVSPLCAKKPRSLVLSRELWTKSKDAVTCKKCLFLIGKQEAQP